MRIDKSRSDVSHLYQYYYYCTESCVRSTDYNSLTQSAPPTCFPRRGASPAGCSVISWTSSSVSGRPTTCLRGKQFRLMASNIHIRLAHFSLAGHSGLVPDSYPGHTLGGRLIWIQSMEFYLLSENGPASQTCLLIGRSCVVISRYLITECILTSNNQQRHFANMISDHVVVFSCHVVERIVLQC